MHLESLKLDNSHDLYNAALPPARFRPEGPACINAFYPHSNPLRLDSTIVSTTKQANRIDPENLRCSSWRCSRIGQHRGDSPGILGPSQHLTLSTGPRKATMEKGCRVKRPPQWTECCPLQTHGCIRKLWGPTMDQAPQAQTPGFASRALEHSPLPPSPSSWHVLGLMKSLPILPRAPHSSRSSA